jgi:hypothetical protein
MPASKRLMAKVRFVVVICGHCGKKIELKQFAVKIFYSVTSDSKTISLNFSRNNRIPGKFVFMLGGKCSCGNMTFRDFDSEELVCEAQRIKEVADDKGVEEGDVELSQEEVQIQEHIIM